MVQPARQNEGCKAPIAGRLAACVEGMNPDLRPNYHYSPIVTRNAAQRVLAGEKRNQVSPVSSYLATRSGSGQMSQTQEVDSVQPPLKAEATPYQMIGDALNHLLPGFLSALHPAHQNELINGIKEEHRTGKAYNSLKLAGAITQYNSGKKPTERVTYQQVVSSVLRSIKAGRVEPISIRHKGVETGLQGTRNQLQKVTKRHEAPVKNISAMTKIMDWGRQRLSKWLGGGQETRVNQFVPMTR